MEEFHSFIPLLVVVVLALFVPLALSRFPRLRLPVVVGEILVGILIGDNGLQWVGQAPVLEILSKSWTSQPRRALCLMGNP